MASILVDVQRRLQQADVDWQTIVIAIVLGVGLFESYIGSRQKRYLSPTRYPHLPAVLRPYLPGDSDATYHKSQIYALDKLRYSSVIGVIDLLESFLLLSSVTAPVWSWLGLGWSQSSWPYFGRGTASWTLLRGIWDLSGWCYGAGSNAGRSMAFVAIMTTLGTILSIPKDYYKNFYLEDKHGFNKMTRTTFFVDVIKSYILSLAIELPVLAGVVKIIRAVGDDGMLRIVAWLLAFIFAFQLAMIPLYPYLVAPLFNKYTPLPEHSPVYPRIKHLAEKLSFPLGRIWVMDGSKRSSHSNAFFFGLPFLTKHIVLYDTLLDKSTPEEVEAILAHELGHWAGAHVLILLGTSLVQTGISLLAFALVLSNQNLLRSFGFFVRRNPAAPRPTIVSLLLAATLFAPLQTFLHFAMNTITRALEYNADAFAVQLGETYAKNLKGALVSIHEKNLALTLTDRWYSALHHSHPTLIERLGALDSQLGDEKKDGKMQ